MFADAWGVWNDIGLRLGLKIYASLRLGLAGVQAQMSLWLWTGKA